MRTNELAGKPNKILRGNQNLLVLFPYLIQGERRFPYLPQQLYQTGGEGEGGKARAGRGEQRGTRGKGRVERHEREGESGEAQGERGRGRWSTSVVQKTIAHEDVLCYKPVSGEADWLINLKKSRALLVPGKKHSLPLQSPEKQVYFVVN